MRPTNEGALEAREQRESKPDLVLFVCEALFGKDGMDQLSMFQGAQVPRARSSHRRDNSNEVRHRERQGGGGADTSHALEQGAFVARSGTVYGLSLES